MSGGGGNTTSNSVSEFKPPEWASAYYPEYVNRAREISNVYGTDPSLIYGNSPNQPMVAQMSDLQNKSANAIYGMASQGNPNENLAQGYLANQLNGGQQNIQPDNPYMGANNDYLGAQNQYSGAQNAYTGAQSSYGGNSPQFENMLNASNQNITDQFMRGTAATQHAAAARSGAFGGSADQEMQGILGGQLANSIAQNTNSMRNDQYNRSAQLEQQDIARNAGISGQDLSRNADVYGQDLSRNAGISAQDLSRNSNLAQNQIQNAWQGFENSANRGQSSIGMINQLGNTDLARWLSVMGAGDLQRQVQSDNIGAAKDLFNRNVQRPLQALDIFGSALGSSSGQGTRSTSESVPGANPWMSGAGGLMALASMFGGQ